MKPAYSQVNVGESAKFTCYSSSYNQPIWVFNQIYPLSADIRKVNRYILIKNVQLNHTGSYRCTFQDGINFSRRYFIASATLKVFGNYYY